jgi:hypothetical protein
VTIEQRSQSLVVIPTREQAARITERQHEQMDGRQLLTEPDPPFAVALTGLQRFFLMATEAA